jgi:hypothetical protein
MLADFSGGNNQARHPLPNGHFRLCRNIIKNLKGDRGMKLKSG